MIRTPSPPLSLAVGTFLVLAAVVSAVAPVPLLFRSLGILLFSYAAFAVAGMPFAYLGALLAPPIGLVTGDPGWLVMLPVVLSSNLLGMLGLEYAWRYPALLVSPALLATPMVVTLVLSRRSLFEVALPWEPSAELWVSLHVLGALAAVLAALVVDRRRERQQTPPEAGAA